MTVKPIEWEKFPEAPKFVGYYNGIEVWTHPDCEGDKIYFLKTDSLSPKYTPPYSTPSDSDA